METFSYLLLSIVFFGVIDAWPIPFRSTICSSVMKAVTVPELDEFAFNNFPKFPGNYKINSLKYYQQLSIAFISILKFKELVPSSYNADQKIQNLKSVKILCSSIVPCVCNICLDQAKEVFTKEVIVAMDKVATNLNSNSISVLKRAFSYRLLHCMRIKMEKYEILSDVKAKFQSLSQSHFSSSIFSNNGLHDVILDEEMCKNANTVAELQTLGVDIDASVWYQTQQGKKENNFYCDTDEYCCTSTKSPSIITVSASVSK